MHPHRRPADQLDTSELARQQLVLALGVVRRLVAGRVVARAPVVGARERPEDAAQLVALGAVGVAIERLTAMKRVVEVVVLQQLERELGAGRLAELARRVELAHPCRSALHDLLLGRKLEGEGVAPALAAAGLLEPRVEQRQTLGLGRGR
eukprot:3007582-Prymnesium_polylepis.2